MTSPFETQLLWASLHQRGRSLLNRLSAAAANAELLEETASGARSPSEVRTGLEALRGELTEAARHTRTLVDSMAAQLPTSTADLGGALRDTLAPLRRHFARRETVVVEAEIGPNVHVAVEPELLRAAISASINALLTSALPSEVLRIEHARTPTHELLSFCLEPRAHAPELTAQAELASLTAWLEVRGGALRIMRDRERLVVALDLPRVPA